MHRNGNGRIRKVKRKGDGEWTSEREKGRKGETILCARFLCRGSECSAASQCRTHMVIAIIFIAQLSPFIPNFPYIFQKEFSHLCG